MLRSLARSFSAFDGAVTFWLLPFTNLACAVAVDALERITPQERWTHTVTGEQTNVAPPNWKALVKEAVDFDRPIDSPWRREYLWDITHQAFVDYLPITVDIDFADALTGELQGLKLFWQQRELPVADRWALFNQALTPAVLLAWRDAYNATRETALALPAGEDVTDPLPVSGDLPGSATSTPTPSKKRR